MFMKDDKKKNAAAIIISRKIEKPESEEQKKMPMDEDGMQSDYEMGMDTAAEDILSAIESKDKQALVSSIKALLEMVKDESEGSERANEEEEEDSY